MLKRLLCLFCSLVGGLTGYSYQIWTDPDTQISWCYTVANSEITLGQGKDGLGGIGGVAVMRNITGELQIPEKVAGCPVVELGERSFSGTTTSGMTSVIIPGTVRRICANAFADCKRLASVSFRDGLVSIGMMAFFGCESLRSITFPTSLKEIGGWAFSRCTSLREVKFNEGLMSVAEWAFSECSSLVSVELPSSVISIDQYSFWWCSNLLVCRSDEGLETIGERAFSGCSNLECVDLPRSLCEIGDDAFDGCWKLNNMIFHGDVPNGFTKFRSEDKYYTSMTVFYPLKYGQYWQRVANDMPTVSFSAIQGTACDVVFDGNGGFPAVTETVQDVGSCYLFPSSCPERTGYKFDGWWTDRTGGVRVTDENYVVRMTKHALYAQWKKCEVIATEAAFHLDASDEVSMIIVTNGAERLVARWSDMYARSNYAEADTSLPALGEFHGKTIVDFGANVTGCDGNGAWLRWLVADASIREVFVVCCDHVTVNPESAERQFLLSCDLNDFSCDFHRDGRKLFSTQNASDKIKNGLVQVDGLTVPYDYVLPGGWHVVHIRTTGEVVANTFAKDRTCRYGGLRIAEVIVYDVTLDDTSADIVQRHLMNKWLGQDPLYKVEFNAMGGSPSPSPLSKASGEAYGDLPEVQKAGYDFAGWWTKPEGGDLIDQQDLVVADIVLFAHWKQDVANYTVTFKANGGSGTMTGQVFEIGRVYKLPKCMLNLPINMKRFAGWDCSNGKRYDDEMLVFDLGDVTMTAIWE